MSQDKMKTKDLETATWETRQAEALDAVPAELGAVVRAARKAEGLGVRELARRAGVSESQISRVENGKTTNPNDDTLFGIADALGRSRVALVALTDRSEGMVLRDSAAEILDTLPQWIQDRHDPDHLEAAKTLTDLRPFARDVFVQQSAGSIAETAGIFPGGDTFFQEVTDLWVGLTPDRRELCRQMVRDQARLSELDRRAASKDA